MSEIREEIIETQFVATYKRHSFTDKGTVDLELKAAAGELPQQVNNIQMINANIKIDVRLPGENEYTYIGVYTIKALNISGDGTSVLKLFSSCEDVVTKVLDELPFLESGTELRFNLKAEVEYDDSEVVETEENPNDDWIDDDDSWGDADQNNFSEWDKDDADWGE